jgi:beta-phosphoglucomutase-like phosphatase (HAD superfamily)
LAAGNLGGRFDAIIGHRDYEYGKPAPDPFLTAAQRLGVVPHLCLALEDSHNGVRSASSVGMMTVMVPDLLVPTDEISGLSDDGPDAGERAANCGRYIRERSTEWTEQRLRPRSLAPVTPLGRWRPASYPCVH